MDYVKILVVVLFAVYTVAITALVVVRHTNGVTCQEK